MRGYSDCDYDVNVSDPVYKTWRPPQVIINQLFNYQLFDLPQALHLRFWHSSCGEMVRLVIEQCSMVKENFAIPLMKADWLPPFFEVSRSIPHATADLVTCGTQICSHIT